MGKRRVRNGNTNAKKTSRATAAVWSRRLIGTEIGANSTGPIECGESRTDISGSQNATQSVTCLRRS